MSVSVREIARHSGFSVAAVSKTLNGVDGTIRIGGETRQKILETVRKLRYRPNNDIGVLIVPDFSYLDPVTTRVLQGVQVEAQERGSHVLCSFSSGDEMPQLIRKSCVGGVVFVHHAPEDMRALLRDKGIPDIVVNPDVEEPQDCILCDDAAGMKDAVKHLQSEGCQRLMFIWEKNPHPSYAKRRSVFEAATGSRGIIHERQPTKETAAEIRELLRDPSPIGFIVFEEMLPLLTALIGTKELERVHIVTINDLLSARYFPPVSSVRVPFLEMGRLAVQMLAEKWKRRVDHIPSMTLRPELVHRKLVV